MKDNKNIDRLFQEKFKDFEATPSDAVWKGIEAELQNKKKKRRVIPFWWTYGGVAAALLLMLAIANGVFNTDTESILPQVVDVDATKKDKLKTDTITIKNTTIASENTSINSETNSENKENKTPSNKSAVSTNSVVSATNNSSKQNKTNLNTSTNSSPLKTVALTTEKENKTEKTSESELNNTTIATSEKATNEDNQSGIKSNSEIEKVFNSTSKNTVIASDDSKKNTTSDTEKKDDSKNVITTETNKTNQTIEEAIAETNALIEKEKEDEKNRWSIAPNVAPVYFNTLAEGSSIDQQFNNNATTSDITVSYGVKGGYAVNNRLKITAGVNRVNFNNSTNDVLALSNNSFASRSSTSNNLSANKIENITFNGDINSASLTILSKSNLVRSSVPESINTLQSGDLDQSFGFIEIPVELEYKVIDKKLGVNVSGGFSTFFLNKNEIFADVNGQSTRIGEANNINNTSFSANFGVGVDYSISEKININLEPKFKYQLNTFNNTFGNFQPFFIGVYTGLSFKF